PLAVTGGPPVLITGFAAGMFQTNCYVLAPAAGGECVIVDPGQDAMEALTSLVAEHGLTPTAVLVTHGHLDHTWSVAPACPHMCNLGSGLCAPTLGWAWARRCRRSSATRPSKHRPRWSRSARTR